MTEGYAALNGSGPQQIYINVYRTGQSGNQSHYRAIGRYLAGGYGSWTNNTQYWSANLGGWAISGTWNIPYENRYNDITLFDVTFSRNHDVNGYGSGFYSTFSIDTDHSSIGDGSVGVSEETPPRIPKVPSACGTPSFSQIGPTSMRVDFAAPSDDGGTGILEYRIRHADNSGMTGAATVSTGGNRFATIGSLPPGAARYVQASARNSVGWGPWSSVGSASTISGGSVKRSGAWTAGRANDKTGGAWSPSVVMKKTAGAWGAAR